MRGYVRRICVYMTVLGNTDHLDFVVMWPAVFVSHTLPGTQRQSVSIAQTDSEAQTHLSPVQMIEHQCTDGPVKSQSVLLQGSGLSVVLDFKDIHYGTD